MSQSKPFVVIVLTLVMITVYLFVTAPAPLPEKQKDQYTIPVEVALRIMAAENDFARTLYTREIVGAGKKQGLKFDEDWQRESTIAGLLPAQFLRETSRVLEKNPVPLGLFLGSDYAINTSNSFEGEYLKKFEKIKETLEPMFFYVPDAQRYAYLAPDFASAGPCVDCHNRHKDSPKTDWKLTEVMGATTWTYPNAEISYKELIDMLAALRGGFGAAYQLFLDEMSQLPTPPVVGDKWPRDGYYVPNPEVFMKELESRSSSVVLKTLIQTAQQKSEVVK